MYQKNVMKIKMLIYYLSFINKRQKALCSYQRF